MELELPYGRAPLRLSGDANHIEVLRAPRMPAPPAIEKLVAAALEAPIGCGRLHAAPGARVTIIVSDATRSEPRVAFLAALRRALPDTRWTIAIATGTHGPCRLDQLGIDQHLATATVVNHDGHDDRDLVTLGTTSRGTPVRVHRCLIDADLVVATGCIRPHYFAGFGAGVKALFPGLGAADAIRRNHQLKTEPRARAGIVDDNPCRDDLVEAAGFVGVPTFVLNAVGGPDGLVHAVVAGDRVLAFRAGVELARPWFTVRARRAPLVIASDRLPVTATLYQAAKIAAATAPLVTSGGRLVVVAECGDGIGPLEVVNEAIFRIGVLPRLSADVELILVSSLAPEQVRQTLLTPASELPRIDRPTLVIPEAAQLLYEVT